MGSDTSPENNKYNRITQLDVEWEAVVGEGNLADEIRRWVLEEVVSRASSRCLEHDAQIVVRLGH